MEYSPLMSFEELASLERLRWLIIRRSRRSLRLLEKYLWHYEHKDGVEDLKKARWYLNRLISTLEP